MESYRRVSCSTTPLASKILICLLISKLIAFSITEKPEPLIKNLRKIYIDNRLPGSDYYRLANSQVNECRSFLEGDGTNNYLQPFLKGPILAFFFILSWFLITYFLIEFAVNPVLSRFN